MKWTENKTTILYVYIYVPSLSTRLHFIGQFNIFWVDVILPLSLSKNASQNCTRVNTNSHVDRWICLLLNVSRRNDNRRLNTIRNWMFDLCQTWKWLFIARDKRREKFNKKPTKIADCRRLNLLNCLHHWESHKHAKLLFVVNLNEKQRKKAN